MARFDAELYLRLVGERLLLDRDHRGAPWSSPLVDAAEALVAVGAVSESLARTVTDDYAAVMALRGEGQPHRLMPGGQTGSQRARTPLSLPRVAVCFGEIETPKGMLEVSYAIFDEQSTAVGSTFRASSPRRQRRGPPRRMGPPGSGSGPPSFTLGDDRGFSTGAHFSGGGSDLEWRGQLKTHQPLARDTAWIEFDGARVELDDVSAAAIVTVEECAEEEPALRHLWQRLATASHFRPADDSLEQTIAALVAAGALDRDAPALDAVRTVARALQHGATPSGGHGALPEPWRSLLGRQGSNDGPTGKLVVGAVTPLFDGISVAVLMLESSEDGFELEVQTTPGLDPGHGPAPGLGRRRVAWWAADDKGNHYLGTGGRWSWGDDRGEGTIAFWPPLDPTARHLVLRPTADTARAVIEVPLVWASAADPAGAGA
jgi:hypothetical protein